MLASRVVSDSMLLVEVQAEVPVEEKVDWSVEQSARE